MGALVALSRPPVGWGQAKPRPARPSQENRLSQLVQTNATNEAEMESRAEFEPNAEPVEPLESLADGILFRLEL